MGNGMNGASYIRKNEAIKKMRIAEENFRPVIILAQAGSGKTSLIKSYFKKRNYLLLSGETGVLDKMPQISKIRQGVVVIDDFSWLDDTQSEEYIKRLLKENSKQIVLSGRGRFPRWLEPLSYQISFERITYEDLRLTKDDISQLFKQEDIALTWKDLNLLMEITKGYPPALKICLRLCAAGEIIDSEMAVKMQRDLFKYYEEILFNRIKEEVQQLLLEVCDLESFSAEMGEALAPGGNVHTILDYCETIGSFITKTAKDSWAIIENVRDFLKWKRDHLWDYERKTENARRVAAWYEKKKLLPEAAEYYEKAGNSKNLLELLRVNSSLHPGVGKYYELREHYENLPEDIVLREPLLIAGISLMHSMNLKAEESDRWYVELEKLAENNDDSEQRRNEAKLLLSYLDIGLPHKAGRGMVRSIKKILALAEEQDFVLPEFSVTDNIPSIINGGLDHSRWVSKPDQAAKLLRSSLGNLLGRHSNGLVEIGLAEIGFESGKLEPHEVIWKASRGIAEAANTGSSEICFAGYGVLARQNLVQGNILIAKENLKAFIDQTVDKENHHLITNIRAMEALLALYESDYDKVKKWLEETPDVHFGFSIMDRYVQQVKLQCLIGIGKLSEARSLAGYLDWYYTGYERTYSQIDNDILIAIISYRQNASDWKEFLLKALKKAEDFHYVQVFSMKGSALMPLLAELEAENVSEEFLCEIKVRCKEMSLKYPKFMRFEAQKIPFFTVREQEILGMLCAGESTEDICRICGISYSGLKKHNHSIYSKLGVKSRIEAERVAASMNLIQNLAE